MSLASALEGAASALPAHADAIRPANGDPDRLLEALSPAGAAQVLAWLLAEEVEAGEELALAWCETEKGAPALLAVDEAALPKPARKALRRALHRLRGRGVAVPTPAPPAVTAAPPKVDDVIEGAFVSSLDPSGARLAWLLEPNPGGGVRLFEMVIDEARGIVDFQAYTTSRSEARRFTRTLVQRERSPAVAVPSDALRALVARCAAAQPADRLPPRPFLEWRSRVTAEGATPGDLAREALGDEPTPERVRQAAELVRSGAFGPWPVVTPALREAAEALREAAKSKLVVSEAQQRERADTVLREAADRVFDAPSRAVLAARLAETGYVLWKAGRGEDARACLSAARGVREGAVADQPVVLAMLEVALAPVLTELKSEEASSLIVRP
jgi:hypothetical protein